MQASGPNVPNADRLGWMQGKHRSVPIWGRELDVLLAEVQENQVAEAPKWEYMQLTSEDLEKAGGLNTLGNKGWELVSMSTYSEGGTVMLIGPQIYHIKALYVLKRPLAPYPEPLREKLEKYSNSFRPISRRIFPWAASKKRLRPGSLISPARFLPP